ncbi:hypothetical protein ACUOA8_40660, partial [Escherichia sp. SS-MK2]
TSNVPNADIIKPQTIAVFASFAPIVTGWVVDTTHSFNLALVIAACVTFTGALCYFFIVKDRIE